MKNILFLVYTEYHMLMIVSLIKNYFSDSSQNHITLLIRSKEGSNRFQHEFNWSYLPVSFHFLPVSERTFKFVPKLKSLLNEILKIEYSHYITFLEHTALNYYITGKLSKRGVKICLAPEGTRPYITINKSALFSRLRFTCENYLFLTKQKLQWNLFQIISNRHGFLKENSEIWIEHPEKYPNLNGRIVKQIELFKDLSEVEVAQQFFGFKPDQELPSTNNIIFYVNHWFVVQELYQYELTIIKKIHEKHPDKPIIIKLHPNTPKSQIEAFSTFKSIVILESTLPAELFILSLNDSLIFSFWSAALMINNPSNKFYWLHKILRRDNPSMNWWEFTNPTKHIIELETLEEL